MISALDDVIAFEDIPNMKIDVKGLLTYAKEKGVEPAYLSEEEKRTFYYKKVRGTYVSNH